MTSIWEERTEKIKIFYNSEYIILPKKNCWELINSCSEEKIVRENICREKLMREYKLRSL